MCFAGEAPRTSGGPATTGRVAGAVRRRGRRRLPGRSARRSARVPDARPRPPSPRGPRRTWHPWCPRACRTRSRRGGSLGSASSGGPSSRRGEIASPVPGVDAGASWRSPRDEPRRSGGRPGVRIQGPRRPTRGQCAATAPRPPSRPTAAPGRSEAWGSPTAGPGTRSTRSPGPRRAWGPTPASCAARVSSARPGPHGTGGSNSCRSRATRPRGLLVGNVGTTSCV